MKNSTGYRLAFGCFFGQVRYSWIDHRKSERLVSRLKALVACSEA